MYEHVVRRFAEAGLTLVIAKRGFVASVGREQRDAIVQIDIQRTVNGSRRHEWFRIFPGADENRIEGLGIDKKFGQIVLLVHEPVREFTEVVSGFALRNVDFTKPDWMEDAARRFQVRARDIRPTIEKGGKVTQIEVVRRTPNRKRHFLCGLDERQLFIAQLPRSVSTVREAHACLKTTTVSFAEGQGIKAARQGEWFFLEATAEETARIEEGVEKNLLVIEHAVPIGPFTDGSARGRGKRVRQFRGNPHTVDELVVLPGTPVTGGAWPVRGREVFIRGRVRHVDHATVKFSGWRKVIRNAESNQGQALGVGWVD